MNILAVDTSISAGSVALYNEQGHQGEVLLFGLRKHSERLMDQIDFLLKSTGINLQQIGAFAVTLGPGSFTGLRVGITTVKTLAMACEKKVIGINTLDLLALEAGSSEGWICPVINAFRGDIYTSLYESGPTGPIKVGGDWLIKPSALTDKICGPTIFTGEVDLAISEIRSISYPWKRVPAQLSIPRASVAAEDAYRRIQNGEGVDPDALYPYYIRRSDAEEKRLQQT
jgi:tRNA threonylcarbamoyladenosine biosynthesis protein TsaB